MTEHTPNGRGAGPTIPPWLIELEYEPGDDLADYDAFECEGSCGGQIWDIDDSTRRVVDGEKVLLCPFCAGLI